LLLIKLPVILCSQLFVPCSPSVACLPVGRHRTLVLTCFYAARCLASPPVGRFGAGLFQAAKVRGTGLSANRKSLIFAAVKI